MKKAASKHDLSIGSGGVIAVLQRLGRHLGRMPGPALDRPAMESRRPCLV